MLTDSAPFAVAPAAATDPRPHAVVIGSGFGGLAAAVRLGARGYRVTVLEALDAPGGRAYVYRQNGHTFDAGPTIITAPFLLEELWALAGRRLSDDVDLRALDHFYRIIFDDGEHIDCLADEAAMRAEVARVAPLDIVNYERFLKHSERIFRYAFQELGHIPFHSLLAMAKAAPRLIAQGGYRNVHGMVARYVKDERLRFALSFHPLFVGGNPFSTTASYCLISHLEREWGVHFAMGGTGALVAGLVGLIERQGGRVRLNARVEQILVREGRAVGVRLDRGEEVAAAVVVSNADSATTYQTLLPPDRRRTRWTDGKLDRLRWSMSAFIWYFGTDRRHHDVPQHTILLGPRYKGLIDDIFENKVVTEDFSLYLYRPTAMDPSLAPPGGDTFYALVPVPNLDSGDDWRALAEPYRRRVEARLSATLLPGLSDHLTASLMQTPLDFQGRLSSFKGAAFGPQPVLLQSAWFRPHNRSEEVDRLYLVGAGTHPGPGVPGVLSSARVLDAVVPHADALA